MEKEYEVELSIVRSATVSAKNETEAKLKALDEFNETFEEGFDFGLGDCRIVFVGDAV